MQSVSLGTRVERVTASGLNSFTVEYAGGAPCGADGTRSVRVEYFCDEELGAQEHKGDDTQPAIVSAGEPRTCEYVVRIHYPKLCTATTRKRITCRMAQE